MKSIVVMATMLEAAEILPYYKPLCEEPFKMFERENQILVISGMGLDNAKKCAEFLFANYTFDELLNIGAAGALNENFKFGKFYEVDSFVDENAKKKASGKIVLLSCNRAIKSKEEREKFAQIADLVDMEAYAIYSVCAEKSKKFKAVKYVSDTKESCDIVENIKRLRKDTIKWI